MAAGAYGHVKRALADVALDDVDISYAVGDPACDLILAGAEHWAIIASLIETCKLCNVEPQNYLTDVMTRIVTGHPNSQIDDLLPWAYPTATALRDVA